MATTLQLRRGTAAEAGAFTGAQGELFIDVENKLVYLHDGSTAGGILVGGTGGGSGTTLVSGSVAGNTLTLTNSDASTVNVNVASLALDTNTKVNGGYVVGGVLTLTNDDSSTANINVSTLAENTYVTSATVTGSIITLHNNNGSTVNIQLPSSVTGFLPGEVQEDMLPQFDAVYDLGSTTERWYDGYFANQVVIGDASLTDIGGTLVSNADITSPAIAATDVVTDTVLIGSTLLESDLITPTITSTEYSSTKGTLVIDGNVNVKDNLTVRNQINLLQSQQTIGNITNMSYTETVITPLTIDNSYANSIQMTGMFFAGGGGQHNVYFNNNTSSEHFATILQSNSPVTLNYIENGVQRTWEFMPSSVYPSGSAVYFYASSVGGIAPYDISAYQTWYFPWWTGSSFAIDNLQLNDVVPGHYDIEFDGTVPELTAISKLFVNNNSAASQSATYSTVYDFLLTLDPNAGMNYNDVWFGTTSYGLGFGLSVMSGSMVAIDAIAASGTITFTHPASGLSWELGNLERHDDMMWGQHITYTVLSASDPNYPTPQSYSTSYQKYDVGIALTVQINYLTYLNSASTIKVADNVYRANSNITEYFNIDDVFAYTLPTTSLVFGDTSGNLTKAITYNELTGDINYEGLVTAISYNESNYSLKSSNATTNSVGQYSISIGNQAWGSADDTIAIGNGAKADTQSSISIGSGRASGYFSTYIGHGGDGMGSQYHSTVIGMVGTGSSGWLWSSGRNTVMLGAENMYLQNSGDYATIINGCSSSNNSAATNLIGGSTWFAPQDRHGEIYFSAYQYFSSAGAETRYPQFGYSANTSIPSQIPQSATTIRESSIWLTRYTNALVQGKITLTILRRNSDDYGIYEIAFVARNSNTGSASIVSQTTTTIATGGSASTYWNEPTLYLQASGYLQFSLTTNAPASGQYITVHVGGNARISNAY